MADELGTISAGRLTRAEGVTIRGIRMAGLAPDGHIGDETPRAPAVAVTIMEPRELPPHLRHIVYARPHHIDELIEAHGLSKEIASAGLAVGLALLKAVAHHEPITLGTAVEALGDWLAERAP